MIIWLIFDPILRDSGRFLCAIKSYWRYRGQRLSRAFFWTWNSRNRTKFGPKRDLNGDIRTDLAQFRSNLNRSRCVFTGIFVSIRCGSFVLINAKLRELWRFSCSFAGRIGVFDAEIGIKMAQNRAICSGALLWAPPSTLFCLNNEEIQQRINSKRFWSILEEFQWKMLQQAIDTRFFAVWTHAQLNQPIRKAWEQLHRNWSSFGAEISEFKW